MTGCFIPNAWNKFKGREGRGGRKIKIQKQGGTEVSRQAQKPKASSTASCDVCPEGDLPQPHSPACEGCPFLWGRRSDRPLPVSGPWRAGAVTRAGISEREGADQRAATPPTLCFPGEIPCPHPSLSHRFPLSASPEEIPSSHPSPSPQTSTHCFLRGNSQSPSIPVPDSHSLPLQGKFPVHIHVPIPQIPNHRLFRRNSQSPSMSLPH